MAIAEASGLLITACMESAPPHEVKLVEKTIDSGFTQYAPDKLIGDKAYDSDPLDEKLMEERCMEWKVDGFLPGCKISRAFKILCQLT